MTHHTHTNSYTHSHTHSPTVRPPLPHLGKCLKELMLRNWQELSKMPRPWEPWRWVTPVTPSPHSHCHQITTLVHSHFLTYSSSLIYPHSPTLTFACSPTLSLILTGFSSTLVTHSLHTHPLTPSPSHSKRESHLTCSHYTLSRESSPKSLKNWYSKGECALNRMRT